MKDHLIRQSCRVTPAPWWLVPALPRLHWPGPKRILVPQQPEAHLRAWRDKHRQVSHPTVSGRLGYKEGTVCRLDDCAQHFALWGVWAAVTSSPGQDGSVYDNSHSSSTNKGQWRCPDSHLKVKNMYYLCITICKKPISGLFFLVV